MWTAVYLTNLDPRSALDIATPYKPPFGKGVGLSCLSTIGVRSLFLIDTCTKKLNDKAWEGRLRGYSQYTKPHRFYNPAMHKVVEITNEIPWNHRHRWFHRQATATTSAKFPSRVAT